VILPQSVDYTDGATVVLVDYPPALEGTATADNTGTATVTFDQIDSPYLWRVERMTTVLSDQAPPAGAQFAVYEGPVVKAIRTRDGSSNPSFDIADECSPITMQPGSQFVAQWTGLRAGTTASVSVQYQLWRRVIAGS
jgi:hypothetical protein